MSNKFARGGAEGPFVSALVQLGIDGTIAFSAWFSTHTLELAIIYGVVFGALVRQVFSRFLWGSRASGGR